MNDTSAKPRRRSYLPFIVILAIIFVPAAFVAATVGADRLGYCVSDMLLGQQGINANPYVQNVSSTSASIVWRRTVSHDAIVRLESPDGEIQEIALEDNEIQIAEFNELTPDTTYTWKVELDETAFANSFSTAPDETGTVVFGVIGDSGTGSRSQWEIGEQLVAQDVDAVLHTGDVVYRRGALCHYGKHFFAPYEDLIDSVPMYPALGNHDLVDRDGSAYFATFVLPESSANPAESYYSFDFGPIHVSVLDSELYESDDSIAVEQQRAWLENDLAASDLPWKITVLHRPPYSSNDNMQSEEIREDLGTTFESGNVDLVLSGHAHNYERFNPVNGVTYVVSGGGGADIRSLEPSESTVAYAETHHLIRIEASPESLTLHVIDSNGQELDSTSL